MSFKERFCLVLWAVVAVPIVGASGCSSGTSSTLVSPIDRGGSYVLEFGDLYFQIEPAGARVTDVHLRGGTNLLTGRSVDSANYGATFWTSPQSDWVWPPPVEIDTAPFTVTVDSPRISFAGELNPLLGASVSKAFNADTKNIRVLATYSIAARTGDKMFAPWEITRVFPGGLTFYPTGTGGPMAGGGFALPPTQNAVGCTWYQHPGAAPGEDQKLLADGSGGWLAHVAGSTVLVKKFADVPAGMTAPGEAEIEVFVQGQGAYVELEEQGAYQPIVEGQSLTWPVTWIVSPLPSGMSSALGSVELVHFVQSLVAE